MLEYLDLELKQENSLKRLYTLQDPLAKQAIKEEILARKKSLEALAYSLIKNPAHRYRFDEMHGYKILQVEVLGGYSAIKARLENETASQQDILSLLSQIKKRGQSQTSHLKQSQNKGRAQR